MVVAIAPRSLGDPLVCCAYASEPDTELTTKALQEILRERLPAHTVPVRWLRYERLPKDDNGKLDRPMIARAFESLEIATAVRPKRSDSDDSDGPPPRFPPPRPDRPIQGTRVER